MDARQLAARLSAVEDRLRACGVVNAAAEAGDDPVDDTGRGVNESKVCKPSTLPAVALRATDVNFRTIDGDTIDDGGCRRGDASDGCTLCS